MSKEKQSEEKQPGITRRDFLKGIAVGAVVTGAVATGVAAVSWPAAPPAPPGAVTKTETVTRTATTTVPATTVSTTVTAPPVTTTATTTLPAVTTTVTTTAPAPPAPVEPTYKKLVTLNVNGVDYKLEVESRESLLDVLREKLEFTGAKRGCNRGECGACTILLDGQAVLACMMLAVSADGRKIVTIEGLEEKGKLHPIEQAFITNWGFQCGYCTPGMILSTKALLAENPSPTEEDAREALRGNLCRCGVYSYIFKSVSEAAKMLRGG